VVKGVAASDFLLGFVRFGLRFPFIRRRQVIERLEKMAKSSSKRPVPAEFQPDSHVIDPWPAPAPAPIGGARFDPEDTWMTFGLGGEGEEEDRTVTVVFDRYEEEESTGGFLGGPLSPKFPGRRR
jgi:hypothetical protein